MRPIRWFSPLWAVLPAVLLTACAGAPPAARPAPPLSRVSPPVRPPAPPRPEAVAPAPPREAQVRSEAVPPAPKPAPPAPAAPAGRMISLHFEDADLEVVLRALADLARVNIVLAQGVKAKVTMWIERVPASEAFAIMQALLEANNLTAIKSGPVYKIVPVAAAAQQPAPIGLGREEIPAAEEGFLTQIVPLQYLSAEDLVRVLTPLVAPGRVLPYRETNSVILSAPTPTIRRLLQIIQTLDVPGKQREVQQTFVYYLENAKARELASILSTIFEDRRGARPPTGRLETPRVSGPAPPPAPPTQPPRPGGAPAPEPPAAAPSPGTQEEGRLVGEVRIVADEPTNALVIKATSADYRTIEETIRKLDLLPKQVLIEVLVAEITLTDSLNFGLEYFLRTGEFALQQFFGLGPIPQNLLQGVATNSTGFALTFVDQDRFQLFLNTLSQHTKINTLATPHILTQNNREAKIQVGQEVPVVTGNQSTVGTGDRIFQTIQQRDIGRILAIKPHVNEKRQVALDIQLEVTDTLAASTVTGTPSFSKRAAQTSVVVEDGQSLLIGGIISDNVQKGQTGIPWLSRIPVLGFLFGTTSDSKDRTELFIMLTPRVVGNPEEGRALTEEFRRRLDWMEDVMRQSEERKKSTTW